jgi:hypothetical protein
MIIDYRFGYEYVGKGVVIFLKNPLSPFQNYLLLATNRRGTGTNDTGENIPPLS